MTPAAARTTALEAMLATRTDESGKPFKGYAENVKALKAEIARLQAGGIVESGVAAFPQPPGTPINPERP